MEILIRVTLDLVSSNENKNPKNPTSKFFSQ